MISELACVHHAQRSITRVARSTEGGEKEQREGKGNGDEGTHGNMFAPDYSWKRDRVGCVLDRYKRSSGERRDRRRPWKSASGGRQVGNREGNGL